MLFIASPFQPSRGPWKPSGWRLVARETNPAVRGLEFSAPPPALQGGERRALPRDLTPPGSSVNPEPGGLASLGRRPPAGAAVTSRGRPRPAPPAGSPCRLAEAGPPRAADALPGGVCGHLGNAGSPGTVIRVSCCSGRMQTLSTWKPHTRTACLRQKHCEHVLWRRLSTSGLPWWLRR